MEDLGLDILFEEIFLIGLGSIGKKHLEISLKLSGRIIVVDPSVAVKDFINQHPQKKKIQLFNSIDLINDYVEDSLVVIANWGPDHFKVFKHFAEIGFKRFLIEKPLTSKISDLEEMISLINRLRLIVKTNMPWNYLNFEGTIDQLTNKNELGPLLGVTVSGGAKCLATIGIHHIGFAIQLFGSEPISVGSSLQNSSINPRHSSLSYLEGTAFWEFPNGRFLTISFSNQSHLQAFSILSYKFGRIIIQGENATIFRISNLEISTISKQVNTFFPNEFVAEFRPFASSNYGDGMAQIYHSFISGISTKEKDYGVVATNSLFGMLISNDQQKVVRLPIDSGLKNHYREFDWRIS